MSFQTTHGTPPLDLIENALHWLRRLPLSAHLAFLVGTVPFLLGLLWFWSDMSRGAHADRRCAGEAVLVAGLYLWMKTWHAVYCAAMRAVMAAAPGRPWTLRRWLRVLAVQSACQPWGLLLFPLSFVPLLLPLPWVFAFFRHADALADEVDGASGGGVLRAAFREAKRWPAQNHGLIGLFLIAGTVVLINVAIVLSQLPGLIKMLTGLESDYTLSTAALVLNSTFLLSAIAVSYLVLMPLLLAVYVRRGFEGASLLDGADLRAEFSQLGRASGALPLVFTLVFFGFTAAPMFRAVGQENPPPAIPSALPEVPALDRAIQEVLNRPDFTWRERRELGTDEASLDSQAAWWERMGRWMGRQLESMGNALKSPLQGLGRALGTFLDWIFGGRGGRTVPPPRGTDEVDWMTGLKIVLYASVAVAVVWLIWYGSRIWRLRRPRVIASAEPEAPASPDLTAENVSATALPEEGWMRLARDLAAKGEFRLAIRAIYLAELAHLGRRELVRLAEAKSNRDYQRELDRRARALPGVRESFAATVLAFDRVWYGHHAATAEVLAATEARFAELRSIDVSPAQPA